MTTTPEITFEIVPANLGLDAKSKESIETAFGSYFEQARAFKEQSATITSAKVARVARLEVKALRVEAEKKRKDMKEDYLRMGKAIDGANNILLAMIVPIEKALEDIEKEEERKAEAERLRLKAEREAELAPFITPGQPVPALESMSADQWDSYLADAQMLHAAKIEAARKAEADRIAREQAEAAERERLRIENERLRAEAVEREAKAKAEREAAEKAQREAAEKARKEREALEAKARAEREAAEKELARIKAEADKAAREEALRQQALREVERQKAQEARAAQMKAEAEIAAANVARLQAEKAAAMAAAKAARAPDKTKIKAFAATVRLLKAPEASTAAGQQVAADIALKIEGFAKWIETQSETL
jgi:colicin import membrane protein